jgi:hypothetical protein
MTRIAGALLVVVVVIQGAYLVKLNRAVARLSAERLVDAAEAPREEQRASAPLPPARAAAKAALPSPAAAPPVFLHPPSRGAPTLDALASPEGRQQLQEVLSSLKDQRRQEKTIKSTGRRAQLDRRLEEIGAAQLGLGAEESQKFRQVLAGLGEARHKAVEELQGGQRSRAEVKRDLDAATRSGETVLTELLGDKRMTAYRELRRREDRALAQAPAN